MSTSQSKKGQEPLNSAPDPFVDSEAFLLRLAHALRERGWRVVYVVAGEPGDAFRADLEAEGGAYRVVAFPLSRQDFDALTASLSGFAPRVLTTTFMSCFSPFLLQLKTRLGIRSWMVHDESSGRASAKSGLTRWLVRLRGYYFGRHVDRVLAVSEFVARRNIEKSFLPKSRVRVLRNGVDLGRFHPAPAPGPA